MTLIDAHVHIHGCFDLPQFFDYAHRNFSAQAERIDSTIAFEGVLMLTELAGVESSIEFKRNNASFPVVSLPCLA